MSLSSVYTLKKALSMQKLSPSSLFVWPRGKPGRWKAKQAVVDGMPDVQIIYADRWPSLADEAANAYSPLSDAHIFEAFIDVGRVAHDAGAQFDQASPRLEVVGGPLAAARQRAEIAVAVDTPGVIDAVLRFVRDYGPLDLAESWAFEPTMVSGETVLRPWEQWLSARRFVAHAAEMLLAFRLASSGEPYPRWLNDVMTEYLRRTHKASFSADELRQEHGAYAWTCDSLLAALWWQFSEADESDRAWRVCKGCKRTFVQSRSDQEYHDRNCRNRAGVAKHAKGRKRDAHEPTKRARKPRKDKGA